MLSQESLSEKMTDLIELEPIDWLTVFPHVFASAGSVFNEEELKDLRLVCRVIRDCASPLLKKLYFSAGFEHPLVADYEALASSSLIDRVKELTMHCFTDRYYSDTAESFSTRQPALLSILTRCSPRLEVLALRVFEGSLDVTKRLLSENVEFPNLRNLTLDCVSHSTIDETVLPSLISMTKLQTLTLGWDDAGTSGLEIFERIPFIENLTGLHVSFNRWSVESMPDTPVAEILAPLLPRPSNLKQLTLSAMPNMEFFHEVIPFCTWENLEQLTLRECYFSDNYSLPRKLTYLKLEHCDFESPTEFHNIFASGKLPILKTLTVLTCSDLRGNDMFDISAAAGNFPNLKDYSITGLGFREPEEENNVDPVRVKKFFSSSIAATLEELNLGDIRFCDEGVREIARLAPNMKFLKSLGIDLDQRQLELMASLINHESWPKLEKYIVKTHKIESTPLEWQEYLIVEHFLPIWPDLKIETTF
jgi:hypothetical protein